jgi:hypothetical protein
MVRKYVALFRLWLGANERAFAFVALVSIMIAG